MRVERPGGWYETLSQGNNYLVNRLLVRAGQQLSLQRHRHRSESWTVVSGSGALLRGETWHTASAGVMLSIPCGAVHRARADGFDLLILEVQHGDDLREDDIERLKDNYGRVIT